MRIAVLANCQAPGLARSVKFFAPDAEVVFYRYNDIKTPEKVSAVYEDVSGSDLILLQHTENIFFDALSLKKLRDSGLNVREFPPVVFQGFHPDMTYLRYEGKEVPGPLDTYHSRIIAACFLNDIEPVDVIDQFNAFNFARFGYFDAYEQSVSLMLDKFSSFDIDLKKYLSIWIKAGSFMHTINHPRICVLSAIIYELLLAHGVKPTEYSQVDQLIPDDLQSGIVWPVYPEIANRLRIQGAMLFKHAVIRGEFKYIQPPSLIEQYYAQYTATGKDALASPAVLEISNLM